MKLLYTDFFEEATLKEIYDTFTSVQEDNVKSLAKIFITKPGLKIDTNEDFNFYLTENSLTVNIGSCVFNDYTFFVPDGDQSVSLEINWNSFGALNDYKLVIIKGDTEWSHPYATVASNNHDVYGVSTAQIAIIRATSTILPYITIASIDVDKRLVIDERKLYQLEMLKPLAPSYTEVDVPETYSIDNLSLSIDYDINSMHSDKPRPGSMHKGRRLIANFTNKDSFRTNTCLGFALKFAVGSGISPQEYFKYFAQCEVVNNKAYLSCLIPHEANTEITVTVFVFFKVFDSNMYSATASSSINIGNEIPSLQTVSVTPLFGNSGILRFEVSVANLSNITDTILYLHPTNSRAEILIESYDFQTLMQSEYDYVMPSGFRYLQWMARPITYGRSAYNHEIYGFYDTYEKTSDITYGMSFLTGITDPIAASGVLFEVTLTDPISIIGAHITHPTGDANLGGVISMTSSGGLGSYNLIYNNFGEGKSLATPLLASGTLTIRYDAVGVTDLNSCTLTILYKYRG